MALDPKRVSREQLETIMRAYGCRNFTQEMLQKDIGEGFPLNEDGTVDIFDYAAFLLGVPTEPREYTPPTDAFNPESVNPTALAGWLTLYNHLGMEIKRGRLTSMFQQYGTRLKAKDSERNINFMKLVAFTAGHRIKRNPPETAYERKKAQENERNKAASAASRDIGELPKVADPQRKEDCKYDFKGFCEKYFAKTFKKAWSDDHLRCIEKIEGAVLQGGLFALALPRGTGKSSLCETAVMWAMLYGHREFVTLIGATESAAEEILDSIKIELETNEDLAADFPEVCYPIQCLEGIANRCPGQMYKGKRTRITWTANEIVLPTIEGSAASGIIVRVTGITGRIRGMKYKRQDGRTVRPTLVIIDDPQTRESAGSIEQNRKRVATLAADILGLAGPGQKISGIMPCTIIRPGDMADQILDRQLHPEWNGEKAKLLYAMPTNKKLWDEYSEIRADCLREYGNFDKATEFYREHQAEMDEGAVVGWTERYNEDEISAVQNAMNLLYQDEAAFASEYQNEPLADDLGEEATLSVDAICQQTNGLERGRVPLAANHVTMFVDVQKAVLFYTAVAWGDDFTGAVIDYGTWPKQLARRFTLTSVTPTLQDKFPKAGLEGQIFSGLTAFFDEIMPKTWLREDGAEMTIEMAMIDANWGDSTETVYQFCRTGKWKGRVLPAHGRYIGASSKPMSEYHKHAGDKVGLNWRIPNVAGRRAIRHIIFDTNFWKSFIHSRLSVALGDKGGLTLWGRMPLQHELYAEHLTAEYRVKTTGMGRTVDEWKLRPDRKDNHWLDCTVGAAVAASYLGCSLATQMQQIKRQRIRLSEKAATAIQGATVEPTAPEAEPPTNDGRRKRISLSDLQKQKRTSILRKK